ncbi:Putative glucanosyltransferase, glycoside hydrolase superfamily [Septoria linicola]|uniref:1,3-beta-glucanosyltransferase n=1 Tax=Septoria linicola TaxID=215465 RepID=A0A9Q9ASJ4_9PEZI|nr:putative glucanosyltransferase, glycoside hydrolase superfamily [Septoria linicola]USW51186.1 Putative glucanosyltransferase, glycoside hydrolase superfamily [Septoria linicola]
MSELAFYLQPRPAYEPIRTQGNHFWRNDERFLIKGINYFKWKRNANVSNSRWRDSTVLDALADEQLDELREDVKVLQELGMNTILVSCLDITKDHYAAFRLLAENGIYVVVEVGGFARSMSISNDHLNEDTDLNEFYRAEMLQNDFRLMHQLAHYENVLGFMVSGDVLNSRQRTRLAPIVRAFVRDARAFLRVRGGRRVPTGMSNPQVMELRMSALQYFTAGSVDERVDFFAQQNYSWCSPSSFQISGWKNMVENLQRNDVCVPMFLAEFGCNTNARTWDEITCLYSRDMLGLFSGGCVYCYEEFGNGYGLVKRDDKGRLARKPESDLLKRRLLASKGTSNAATHEVEVKDYESWQGDFPSEGRRKVWLAGRTLPNCPIDLHSFALELKDKDERERDLVHRTEGLHIDE